MLRRAVTRVLPMQVRTKTTPEMIEKLTRIRNKPFEKVDRSEWLQPDSLKNNEDKRYQYAANILSKPHLEPLSSSKEYPRYTRNDHLLVKGLPPKLQPQTVEQGFRIQQKIIEILKRDGVVNSYDHKPFVIKGWKVGASQPKVQSELRIDEPFLGVIFEHQYHTSPHTFVDDKVDWVCYEPMAECEFLFVFKKDLPPRNTPYTTEEVIDAISHVNAAVELVANRIENIAQHGGIFTKVADCGSHYALIVNEKERITSDYDQLWNNEMVLRLNDDILTKAKGNYVFNGKTDPSDKTGPLDTTVWAVNELTNKFSIGITAGQVISSGTCTGKTDPLEKDDEIVADFNTLGKVEVNFT